MRHKFYIAIVCFTAFAPAGCRSSVDELRIQTAFAIQNGLDFVAVSQTSTGGFITDCWRSDGSEQRTQVDAIFTAAQVLYSLSFCPDSASARGTRERAARYLMAQQKAPGVWSYYGQGTNIVISPDVDDTSVSWAAFQRFGAKISPGALDAVRTSRNERGLFTTWVGDPSHWANIASRDIGTVVNLNALLLCGLAP